jgi:hypothetical protein
MTKTTPMPSRYEGRWIGADGRIIFDIVGGSPPRVSATDGKGFKYLDATPARFAPASDVNSRIAHHRLDTLHAELGEPGLGSTLRLMFCVANDDISKFGGLQWVHVPESADASEIRMHPEQGASYYEAVLGPWDDFVENLQAAEGDWLRPYNIYSRAL